MSGMKLKKIITAIAAENGKTMPEVAEGCGKKNTSLHQMLDRNNMTIKEIKKVMNAMGEDLVFVTKSGNKYQYE